MKIHALLFSLVIMCFFAGRYMVPDYFSIAETREDYENDSANKKVTLKHSEVKMLEPKPPEHFQKLKRYLPGDKTAKSLIEIVVIEDMPILTLEARQKHREYIEALEAEPETSFTTLSKAVKSLPPEFEAERTRFLQLAVDLDVPTEEKQKLLENFLLDGRYSNEKLNKQLSKIAAFDYLIEHAGRDAAREVLKKASFDKELRGVLETLLIERIPAAQEN